MYLAMERVRQISSIVPKLDKVAKKKRILLGLKRDECLKLLDLFTERLILVGVPAGLVAVVEPPVIMAI